MVPPNPWERNWCVRRSGARGRKLCFLEGLKLLRIKQQMRYAARHGLTFHLWWHPHNIGVLTDRHLQQLEEIFACYQQLKETWGMESLTMQEAASRLEKEEIHG